MREAFKERDLPPWVRLAIARESIMFTIACVLAIAKTFVLEINRSQPPWGKRFRRKNSCIRTFPLPHGYFAFLC